MYLQYNLNLSDCTAKWDKVPKICKQQADSKIEPQTSTEHSSLGDVKYKAGCREYRGSMLVGVDMQVEMVGGQGIKIGCRWEVLTQRGRY